MEDYLVFLADDVIEIFSDLRSREETVGLSDETVATMAAGVLEARQIMKVGQQ